jgi:hypothetical protein
MKNPLKFIQPALHQAQHRLKAKALKLGEKMFEKHVLPLLTKEDVFLNYVNPAMHQVIRQVMVKEGLDPDYVKPESLTGVFDNQKRLNVPFMPSWFKASLTDPTKHPVMAARLGLPIPTSTNTAKWMPPKSEPTVASHSDTLQALKTLVAASPALEEELDDVQAASSIPLVKDDDVNTLRQAMQNIHKEIFPAKKAVLKKPAKKSKATTKTKKAAKKTSSKVSSKVKAAVTRDFGGGFRRVTER